MSVNRRKSFGPALNLSDIETNIWWGVFKKQVIVEGKTVDGGPNKSISYFGKQQKKNLLNIYSSPTRQNKQNETSFFAVHECSHFPAVVKC